MAWEINGENLDSGAVTGLVAPGYSVERSQVTQLSARVHATSRFASLGQDRGRHRFRLEFRGPAPDRLVRANYFRDILLNDIAIKLEAPPLPNVIYFNDGDKFVYLTVTNVSHPYEAGLAIVRLDVEALEATAGEAAL